MEGKDPEIIIADAKVTTVGCPIVGHGGRPAVEVTPGREKRQQLTTQRLSVMFFLKLCGGLGAGFYGNLRRSFPLQQARYADQIGS